MTTVKRFGMCAALGAGALVLSGCGVGERMLWGEDGAAVKDAARTVIAAGQAGEQGPVCEGAAVDLGEPAHWAGAGAGEPEQIEGRWTINVELGQEVLEAGAERPGTLTFAETDSGLCLAGHEPTRILAVHP